MPRSKYSIDLKKQMAVCDANYIRLLKLVPQLEMYRSQIFRANTQVKALAEIYTIQLNTLLCTAFRSQCDVLKIFKEC